MFVTVSGGSTVLQRNSVHCVTCTVLDGSTVLQCNSVHCVTCTVLGGRETRSVRLFPAALKNIPSDVFRNKRSLLIHSDKLITVDKTMN